LKTRGYWSMHQSTGLHTTAMWLKQKDRVRVLNTTFNNISVILWRSVLLVEERLHGENHRPVAKY